MRHLGIDFGERRIGLAISDQEGRLSVALTSFERRDDKAAIGHILSLAAEHDVDGFVVGEPRGLDGTVGAAAKRARSFAAKLRAASDREVHLIDEALTSHEAAERLREAGVAPRRRRGKVDALAAQILLQDWLDEARS